jgi:hypothetical protein
MLRLGTGETLAADSISALIDWLAAKHWLPNPGRTGGHDLYHRIVARVACLLGGAKQGFDKRTTTAQKPPVRDGGSR